MVIINNFSIINSGTQLAIDVETTVGYNITSVLLWQMNDFKDYSLAKNLTYKLQQINNKEVIIVDTIDAGVGKFEDIYFLEVESDDPGDDDCSTCQQPALAITYNLTPYYQCLLSYFLSNDTCISCEETKSKDMSITVSLLIDMIEKGIEVGYYTQAIDMIKKLKKLCSLTSCTSCKSVECSSCSKFVNH